MLQDIVIYLFIYFLVFSDRTQKHLIYIYDGQKEWEAYVQRPRDLDQT